MRLGGGMSAIDIIVRGKDNHELTRLCLDSIAENTAAENRIILVDDGSQPAYEFECDYYVRSERSRGAVTATNLGLSVSMNLDGDYVVVMDNDAEVPRGDLGWLDRFVKELEAYPNTAVVGATSGYVSGDQFILACPQTYTGDWKNEDGTRWGYKDNAPVRAFVSFCCLMRKDVVRQVGLWDERYNPGNYEDTDYAVQVRNAGYDIRVARSVYIHHRGHSTFGPKMTELMEANHLKFARKWGVGRLWDMGLEEDGVIQAVMQARRVA